MKERPILFSGPMVRAILDGSKTQTRRPYKPKPGFPREDGEVTPTTSDHWIDYGPCPLGQPGDRLWVRETWRVRGGREYEYQQHQPSVVYRADVDGFDIEEWRPSIHMPRWASRITLEITSVWVERVQDITEKGAIKEGFDASLEHSEDCNDEHCELLGGPYDCIGFSVTAKMGFRDVWQSIYGTWSDNPWVWAVEFRRVKP